MAAATFAGEQAKAGTGLRIAFAAVAYLVASILLTWPVAERLDTMLFADYGDARGGAWWVWTHTQHLTESQAGALLAAPFGLGSAEVISQPIAEGLVLALARIGGDVAGMNLFVLLAFPATAAATFVLLDRLLDDGWAAFVGGLAFGFCPAAVMQAVGGHAFFAWNAFVVLFVLALFHNREHRTTGSALLVAAAFAATIFTSIYIGYFALYLAAAFVVIDALGGDSRARANIVRNYLACAAFAAMLVVPVELGAIREQLTQSREAIASAGHIRDFSQVDIYAARPWNYLLPSIDHPVLGRFVEDFTRSNLNGSNVFEQTLYLGVVPLGLLLAGVVILGAGGFDARHKRYFAVFVLGALLMYILSLPSRIAGSLPGVSFFAYDVAPMFRVYARAGILVALLVACAAAVVLAHLHTRMRRAHFAGLVTVLLPLLAFDYWSVPAFRAGAVDMPPPVYRWLATLPGDFIVAEYPMAQFDEAAFYTYPFWQRVHRKRLVNGASPDNPHAWRLFERIRDLGDPQVPHLLAGAGVRYVIVHPALYVEGPIPDPLKRYYPPEEAARTFNGGVVPRLPSSLSLCRTVGEDLVFVIESGTRSGSTGSGCR